MKYLCASCKKSRDESNIELIAHPNESLGNLPICTDKPCEVTDVSANPDADETKTETDSFKVEDTLK